MDLASIIKRMDELKAELDSLRPIAIDRVERLNQKLRLDWNYHSNGIEGNTLSLSETKAFILHGITAKGKPFRDYVEMRGHNEALKKLENIVSNNLKINENLIKEFHKIILVEPFDTDAEINPGHYKTLANYLYSPEGERIDFEPPEETPRLVNELVNWLNNHIEPPKRKKSKYDLHPLLISAGFHARFIQIHPFGDGNGRMARILSNLILMVCGYVPAIVKLETREDYYSALNASSQEDPKPLAELIGKECINSLELAIKAAKGESISDPEDWRKQLQFIQQEFEQEDAEKEIKVRFNKQWFIEKGISLVERVFNRVLDVCKEFDSFYDRQYHRINLQTTSINQGVEINNNKFPMNDIWEIVKRIDRKAEHDVIKLTLHIQYGVYKKSGLNPFGCSYQMWIEFSEFYQEIVLQHRNNSGSNTFLTFKKVLLHQEIEDVDITLIANHWGSTLTEHLSQIRKEINKPS
ncbi:MAG: Fic family protein [Bacteroidetes bacterium]|nr:Fic family protein [Bacteroidota bacterium]